MLVLGAANLLAAVVEFLPYGARAGVSGPEGLYLDNDIGLSQRPALRPGASLRGVLYRIDINSLGFRGPELREPKPREGLRVWCVGGSTTFDIYAPDNASTWPARLGERLATALPERVVEVVNAGIPGEIFYGARVDFERFYPLVQPDILVVYGGPNDLRKARDTVDPPVYGLGPPLGLAIARLTSRVVLALRPPRDGFSFGTAEMDGVVHELEPLLAAAETRGTAVVLASHALRVSATPGREECWRELKCSARLLRAQPEEVAEAYALYNARIRELSEARGYGFADVRAAVPADHRFWGDDTHFAAPGSAIAGEVVATAILEQGLVPPVASDPPVAPAGAPLAPSVGAAR